MTHSWKEKLDEAGVQFVEANAKARQIKPLASMDIDEIDRWLQEQGAFGNSIWPRCGRFIWPHLTA